MQSLGNEISVLSNLHGITQELPMFGFPLSTSANLIKDSIGAQVAFFSAVSESILNTSRQINELNVQAVCRLMEESASDMQRALQIRSLPETGVFLVEQSQATMEKVRGYQQNIQNIMTSNQVGMQKILDDVPAAVGSGVRKDENHGAAEENADTSAKRSGASPGTGEGTGTRASESHAHSHHETEHRAPPLVEKLIASVVSDTGNPNHKS
jgi:Phasin protein